MMKNKDARSLSPAAQEALRLRAAQTIAAGMKQTEAVHVFGRGMVGAHLVVGLGETEQEMAGVIQQLNDLGCVTHLFSFFPEQGTPMDSFPQPSYGHYRRVQLARYMINEGRGRYEQMRFDAAGRSVDFATMLKNVPEPAARASQ